MMGYYRLVDSYYTEQQEGYRGEMPVLHLFVRDQQWERHHVRVDGFRSYFCVPQSEWVELGEEVAQDDRVLSVETEDLRGRPEVGIGGEPLVRIVCETPGDVRDLQELFDNPYEADVQFPVRFNVDYDIFQWVSIPDEYIESGKPVPADELRLDVDDSESAEQSSASSETSDDGSESPDEVPPPRVCTYDIEVRQGGGGPSVVSEEGTEQARNPVTAITAHDSYTGAYRVWLLAHDDWDVDDSRAARNAVEADVSVYKNPKSVVGNFFEYVTEYDFDILTGWNASTFDHPYLINWALNNDVNSVYNLSPTGDVHSMSGDGSWINSSLKGRMLLDSLTLYKKTLMNELNSYRLADVAQEEDVGTGKLDIGDEIDVPEGRPDIDFAWKNHPDVFTEYSVRDVKACVSINDESKENVTII